LITTSSFSHWLSVVCFVVEKKVEGEAFCLSGHARIVSEAPFLLGYRWGFDMGHNTARLADMINQFIYLMQFNFV
jgi:hypothetical protein